VARTEIGPGATLVDANVLLDLLTDDERWSTWSTDALLRLATEGRLVINPVIFAETSAGFATAEDANRFMPADLFEREQIPWAAAFLAGQAHAGYRRRGGTRTTTLPDFFIGAHAAVAGYRLLTRDARRYRSAFPRLELIAPA
jgi:hypothetical protein